MLLTNTLMYTVCFVLCFIGTHGKPSLSFNFHSFNVFNGFSGPRNTREAIKSYTGERVRNDSLIMVYYHDQTIAVAELGPNKLLLNCELVEVNEPEEAMAELRRLKKYGDPLLIGFKDMMDLMLKCEELDTLDVDRANKTQRNTPSGRGILANNPFTLLSGIIPGTKWCGTGDIAENYHDLGADANVDRCCRTHDYCPVKVKANTNRYNLTNFSIYTKSHCVCDDELFYCLRRSNLPTAHLMGNVYFNIVQVPCVQDIKNGSRRFRTAKSNF